MKKITFSIRLFALIFLSATMLASCDKKNEIIEPTQPQSRYAFVVHGGAFPNVTTYLQGIDKIEGSLTIDNAKEFERPGILWGVNGRAYLSLFSKPMSLSRYDFNESGELIKGAELIHPTAMTVPSICYIDENEAYAAISGAGGIYDVIRFNPVTMKQTGTISLSNIKKDGIETILQMQIVHRGGKLFMGLVYGFLNPLDEAFVAVIDRSTLKVEKVISDARTSNIMTGGNTMGSLYAAANGDIYVLGEGSASKPSGVLRIKNNESEFDKTFFINLDEQVGTKCKGMSFVRENTFVTTGIIDPKDPWEMQGPNYHYYAVDIAKKASLGKIKNLPATYGVSNCAFVKKFNDGYYLNAAEKDISTIYKLDPSTLNVEKKAVVEGNLTGLVEINN